ncbi:MAG TPA: T9SS type A sorting domain-containing protein, partial [Candidatus Marinimicrobia bacterium]|nr:T9SS type A sorting domain-containing protein [Candidatus Neomarinimicrobiota bacterium]
IDHEVLPTSFALHQNYPNPFNPVTTLRYDLPQESDVTLTIYDITGRMVQTLVNELQQAGMKKVIWNASDVSSGVYIYRIQAGNFTKTRKMILLK